MVACVGFAISHVFPQTAYMSDGRAAAVRAAQARMGEMSLTQEALAKRARVDLSTVNTFLNGRSWPQVRTRARLEVALDWPPGKLSKIANGEDPDGDVRAELQEVREMVNDLTSAMLRLTRRVDEISDNYVQRDGNATPRNADSPYMTHDGEGLGEGVERDVGA